MNSLGDTLGVFDFFVFLCGVRCVGGLISSLHTDRTEWFELGPSGG